MTNHAWSGPIEPLFASNERLWLRVWGATQGTALVIAAYGIVDRAGGIAAFVAGPSAQRTLGALLLLVTYHVIGVRARSWILSRTVTVLVFVPLGWLLILWAASVNGGFGLLILGAIIQGFIFLPFAWAIGILALVMGALITNIVIFEREWTSAIVARVSGVLATGIMIGTVMLYIHRVNRDSAIRARLLQQLDEAQRDLAERARTAGIHEERQRLAHDIHDTLAQGFASVIKHLEAIELTYGRGEPTRADILPHLKHAQDVSRSSLAEIRRLVWALRPPQLTEQTLSAALERIVAQWSAAQGVPAHCTIDPLPTFLPEADVVYLRATQEALSNVARHAHATQVVVTFTSADGLALLTIEDNGRGFVETQLVGGDSVGVQGMRERVHRFGGRVLVESTPREGTSITVAMPLAAITMGDS